MDPGAARALWGAAVDTPGWQGEEVWLHRDLDADNLVATRGQLGGVIDLGGLVVGDPDGNAMAPWHVLPAEHRPTSVRIVGADPATQLCARGWALSQGPLALPCYLGSHDGMVRMARRAITAALDPGLRTAPNALTLVWFLVPCSSQQDHTTGGCPARRADSPVGTRADPDPTPR